MVLLTTLPTARQYDLSSVHRVICGAAPLSKDIGAKILKIFNIKYVTQAIGNGVFQQDNARSPDLNPIQHVWDKLNRRLLRGQPQPKTLQQLAFGLQAVWATITQDSHTRLFHGQEMSSRYRFQRKTYALLMIVDLETGKSLPANKDGEVYVRGPSLMKGYLSNPGATSAMYTEDGWMKTGDIGHVDDDGFLFIVDRLKELIKYKAFQVAPAELEDVLLSHPGVADVGVIGIPDVEAGELPKAFVVRKTGSRTIEQELQDFVKYLGPRDSGEE
ncbi:4-coumarate--CoA ligase-like 5 [Haliotis rufescens]|uniref:4-coumarate--CoA ligase-like 5 n=1 Tax=Haliotis rufescens TaxID=6454 RepID=UPI00201EAC19|nr:4-coumarate--CoA ligase-like 5 [Haliotis rufescens]